MQTIAAQLDQAFRQAIQKALGIDADPVITVAQNEKFGDYQANAAMGLARQVSEQTGQKTNPRQVAEQIKAAVDLGDAVSEISIAGPGFINVRLSPAWLSSRLSAIAADPGLGIDKVTAPKRVVVDYSGPNIAKEMHVGNLRSTIIGDAIVRVLTFQGHEVIRQNHIGDWGLQMGMVTYALQTEGDADLTLANLERVYKKISLASEDPAVRRQMAERTRELQQTPKENLAGWQRVRDLTLRSAQDIYTTLGVLLGEADVRGESFYSDRYEPLVRELKDSGKAVISEGALCIFPPDFSNKEGEPRPFIIQSRDGTFQYPTFDLAALRFRIQELRAQRIIYTHDTRQAEHFAMLFAVAHLLGWDQVDGQPVEFDYAPFGTILGEDGKPFKTRSGETVRLNDLLIEAEERAFGLVSGKNPELDEALRKRIARAVGMGAVKYADLSKDRTSDYIFSWEKMLAMDGNTAPYLQYAYARIQSIFRKAGNISPNNQAVQLESPYELALAKHILRLGEIIELVARELKPHHLAIYLYELATRFSSFYENCDVLKSPQPIRQSRLLLCAASAKTLQCGLDLLGIEHPDQM